MGYDGAMTRRTLIASLGLAVAVAALLHAQVLHPYSVPDYGDPLFSMWRMGWVQHALLTDSQRLFDGNIFYPQPLALTLSDAIILPALAGLPLRALGVHPVLVYNGLVFLGFWLSGVTTYLLVNRLTGSAPAAFVAGLIYASFGYRFDHYSHLELQMTMWMPLALLALHQWLSTARGVYALALALTGVALLYSAMYYAVFFLVFAAVVGAGLFLVHRPPVGRLVWPLVAALLVSGALAAPLVRAFVAAQPVKGDRSLEEVQSLSATPRDYVSVSRFNALWHARLPEAPPEHALFPGVVPVALAAAGVASPLGMVPLVYGAGLAVAVDASLGVHGVSYPLMYRWLTPFRGLRSPARFGAIVGLALAVLAGFGAQRLFLWWGSRGSIRLLLAGLVVLLTAEAWPALTLVPVWRQPPAVYQQIAGRSGVVLAEYPVRDTAFNIQFMYLSIWHWIPMLNGYSGFIPPTYQEALGDLRDFPLGTSITGLRRRGVTHVTMNCALPLVSEEDCDTMTTRMRRSSELRFVAASPWERSRVELYEVLASP